MLIAEDLVKSGIATGGIFNDKLTEFVREKGFTKIIETGTYNGLGSTTAILNGMSAGQLITIEADPVNYRQAVNNLKGRIHFCNR